MSPTPELSNIILKGLLVCNSVLAVIPLPCDEDMSIELKAGAYVLYENNSLLDIRNNILFDSSLYFKTEADVYRACICQLRTCIRKCCGRGEAYILHQEQCAPSNSSLVNPFSMSVHNVDSCDTTRLHEGSDSKYFFLSGFPRCDLAHVGPTFFRSDSFQVLSTGDLQRANYPPYDASEYCMDLIVGDKTEVRPIVCFWPLWKQVFAYAVPIPFLLLTFIVFPCVEELRNCHGKSLMCLVGSLLTWFVLAALAEFGSFKPHSTSCSLVASILQFFRLASIFWLNAVCFDIWWRISGWNMLRNATRYRKDERTKFILSSVYAWGCPFLICSATAVVNYNEESFPELIRPEFGIRRCFFNRRSATLLYLQLPSGILVSLNVVFVVIATVKIYSSARQMAILRRGDTKRHSGNDLHSCFLYIKLFVLMGTNAAIDSMLWFRELRTSYVCLYIFHGLQGVFIFIVFICNRKTLALLCRKVRTDLSSLWETTSRPKTEFRYVRPEELDEAVAKRSRSAAKSDN